MEKGRKGDDSIIRENKRKQIEILMVLDGIITIIVI